MWCYLALLAVCAVGAFASYDYKNCYLKDIPVYKNLDERKLAGRWYQTRYFYGDRYNPSHTYRDYVVDLYWDDYLPGYRDYGCYQYTYKNPYECKRYRETRKRVSKGVYSCDYDYGKYPNTYKYVVDTDYEDYFIEYQCLKHHDGYCQMPETILWTRRQSYTRVDVERIYSKYLGIFGNKNVCINHRRYWDCTHKNEDKCYPEKYGYGYGYPGYGYPGRGYGYGYPYGGYYGDYKYDYGKDYKPDYGKDYKPDYKPDYGKDYKPCHGKDCKYDYGKYGYSYGGYGYGYGYPYGYGNYYGYDNYYYGNYKIIKEIQKLRIASEKAEARALDAQEHTERLKKEKLALLLDYHKRGLPYPKGIYWGY